MRKIMLLCLLMFTLQSYGQKLENLRWNIRPVQSDELKGTQADTMYIYKVDGMGYFGYHQNNKGEYLIRCDNNNLFDVKANMWFFPAGTIDVQATIGLYNDSDKLIEKLDDKLDAGKIHNSASSRKKHKGIAKKIINWLETSNGYVRIVAPRLGTTDFDIIVPHR